MPRTKLPGGSAPVTFRLPKQVQKILTAKARREKISFSELVRRALRRELKPGQTRDRRKMNAHSRE